MDLTLQAIKYWSRDKDQEREKQPEKKEQKTKEAKKNHSHDKSERRTETTTTTTTEGQERDSVQSKSVRTPNSSSKTSEQTYRSSDVSSETNLEPGTEQRNKNMQKVLEWEDGFVSAEDEYERCMRLPERRSEN